MTTRVYCEHPVLIQCHMIIDIFHKRRIGTKTVGIAGMVTALALNTAHAFTANIEEITRGPA